MTGTPGNDTPLRKTHPSEYDLDRVHDAEQVGRGRDALVGSGRLLRLAERPDLSRAGADRADDATDDSADAAV